MDNKVRYFELTVWPHVRTAYNFARWLVRNNHDAEDIVQESFLKAYQALETFRGGDARPWLLSIVRNTAANVLRRPKAELTADFSTAGREPEDHAPDPERSLLDRSRREQVHRAISQLAPEFQEVVVLREIEDLSYKEIAAVLNIPIGTVMSRLSRARGQLLVELCTKEVSRDLS
ncbi:MAG: sigma-70 family RNA polymerase sigma factor [Bryobacteraceae bacterium]